MKRLRVFGILPGWDASLSQGYSPENSLLTAILNVNVESQIVKSQVFFKVVRYSFPGPYLAFLIVVLPTFHRSDRCENNTSFWKTIEV